MAIDLYSLFPEERMYKAVPVFMCSCWLKCHGKFLSEIKDLDEHKGFLVFQQALVPFLFPFVPEKCLSKQTPAGTVSEVAIESKKQIANSSTVTARHCPYHLQAGTCTSQSQPATQQIAKSICTQGNRSLEDFTDLSTWKQQRKGIIGQVMKV